MKNFNSNLNGFATLALIVSLMVVSGCASKAVKPFSSYQVADFPVSGIEVIATHLSNELAVIFPPGHTTFFIHQTDSPEEGILHLGHLGKTFEQALRSRGFLVEATATEKAFAVSYVLDMIDPNTCYTRLTVSNGLTLTRTYQINGDTLEIVGGTRTSLEGQKQ